MTHHYNPNLAASVTATGRQILMPLIRQVYPQLLAQSILGVQPMTDSVAEIFTMKASYKQQPKYKFSRAKWYEAEFWDLSALPDTSLKSKSDWCKEQFGPHPKNIDAWSRWYISDTKIYFRDEKDYQWFILRWGA